MTNTDQYLIADSKAHIEALMRATDEKTRDRIRKAMMMNSRDRSHLTPSKGSTVSNKVSG